jgi:hypothetical protein
MKKKIWIPIATFILIVGAYVVFSALHPAPKVIVFENELYKTQAKFSKADVHFLNKIGFEKSKNVDDNLPILYEEQSKYFKQKFGLEFFGEKVINKTLKETGLIIGSTHQYKGLIPDKNVEEIRRNLQILKPDTTTIKVHNKFLVFDFSGKQIDVIDERSIKSEWLEDTKTGHNDWANLAVAGGKYPEFATIKYVADYDSPYGLKQADIFNLLIIASAEEFELTPDQIVEGNKIVDKPKVKDPMVLLKVDGGYVKLTSWN